MVRRRAQVRGELLAQHARGPGRRGCGRSSRWTPAEPARRGRSAQASRRSAAGDQSSASLRGDELAQPRLRGQLAELGAASPVPGPLVGPGRPVARAATVAGDLAADRRGRPSRAAGDRPQREALGQPAGDLLPLGKRQHARRAAARRRHVAAVGSHDAVDRSRLPAERPPDLAQRLAGLASVTRAPASARPSTPACPSAPSIHLPIDTRPYSVLHRSVEPTAAFFARETDQRS